MNKGTRRRRFDSIHASITFQPPHSPDAAKSFSSREAFRSEQLTSVSIMIYYVMDNLYFLLHHPTPLNQATIHSVELLSSLFFFFIFHHPKMFFIEIYFVITFSYPPLHHPPLLWLLFVVGNGCRWLVQLFPLIFDVESSLFPLFVSLHAMNKNVTKMMFIFSTACSYTVHV